MDKKSQHRSRDSDFQRKLTGRRNYIIRRDLEEQYKRTRSTKEIVKRRWTSMERQWSDICYDSILKELSKELTLVLSDTRELDRVPSTK